MLTEKKNGNSVVVRGTLSENNLSLETKDGRRSIRGEIIVKVVQDEQTMFIPIRVFVSETKKDGSESGLWQPWVKALNYKSIAAVGENEADRVECSGARIAMNEYYKNGKLVSFPTIRTNFITTEAKKVNKPDEATWSAIMFVGKCGYHVDEEGVEDKNQYDITGILPTFTGSIDIVPMKAVKPTVIDVIANSWQVSDTVKAIGKLYFTQEEKERKVETDFGEPQVTTYTVNTSDIIITGGAQVPLEGEFAYDIDDIREGKEVHQKYLDDQKQKELDKSASGKSTTSRPTQANLGF